MSNAAEEQKFLDELDKKLWNAADRLRSNLDAAVYKHAVLGLIFLKYVSDAFEMRRETLLESFKNSESEDFLDPSLYESEALYEAALQQELEDRDYYTSQNVFWVPSLARWETIRSNATLASGSSITLASGEVYKFRSIGGLLDDALEAIEKENPRLKGILEKNRYSQLQLPSEKLIGLISEVISSIPFDHKSLNSKDILGHVYEYFLGRFAQTEGQNGGQFYTPKSIVSLIVEMLEPYKGKIYDPACGSGGFFVSSERFIKAHGGRIGDVSIYGQESNPTTWRLAAMNMAIRGIEFNFGKQPADSFLNNQHPDLRADYIMANPPFNIDEWWSAELESDVRWQYGTPPSANANFAWVQHMVHHLAPTGSMAFLLANGSMTSNTNNEGDIRKALIKADLIECILELPTNLFANTTIPACIWFLTKDKGASGRNRERKGETLFIRCDSLGFMKTRKIRDFSEGDIAKVASVFHNWKRGTDYSDQAGFCYSAELVDIEQADFVLTPGRYVGAAEEEEDSEPFAEKFNCLKAELDAQFEESSDLEAKIKANLEGLGL